MPAITNQPATATSIARRAGAVIATPPAASSAASSTKKKTTARGKTSTTPSTATAGEDKPDEDINAHLQAVDMSILQEGNARSRGMRGFNLDEANSLGTVHPRNDARRANAVMFQDDESSSTDVVVIDPVAPHAAADPTGFQPNNNNATPRSSTNSVDMSHDESADGMEDAAMAE